MTDPSDLHVDSGLAPERTTLAWERTVLSASSVVAAAARTLHRAMAILVLIGFTAVLVGGWRHVRRRNIGGATNHGWPLVVVAGAITGAALVMWFQL